MMCVWQSRCWRTFCRPWQKELKPRVGHVKCVSGDVRPMPLRNNIYPGGICENSPTFERWGKQINYLISPGGTAELAHARSTVPSGRNELGRRLPNVETLG